MKVIRKEDGAMIKLTQYNIIDDELGGTSIVPIDGADDIEPIVENDKTYWSKENVIENGDNKLYILNPEDNTVYHLEQDLENPYYRSDPYVEITFE
mgnify:CR=1 FL=1